MAKKKKEIKMRKIGKRLETTPAIPVIPDPVKPFNLGVRA